METAGVAMVGVAMALVATVVAMAAVATAAAMVAPRVQPVTMATTVALLADDRVYGYHSQDLRSW